MEQWIFLPNKLLNDKQCGFRQKYSTYMAILETINQISEALDNINNLMVGAVQVEEIARGA